jgi:amidophosphoribosyltransferase
LHFLAVHTKVSRLNFGTTSQQIVQMARDAGAKKVFFASAAPAVRYPNVYGIDMASNKEFIAHNKNTDEVCQQPIEHFYL